MLQRQTTMPLKTEDTIAAIATPPGRGGIGIIRLSGTQAKDIAETICSIELTPRQALFARFHHKQVLIDEGLVIYFPAPRSFTGEEVVELQGHGGAVVQKMLMEACLALGARMANPGEFSQRAFLNDRLDLTQVEAIADLIDAGTEAGVRAANRSLQGVFSKQVTELQDRLTHIRVFIEAAIDFPEEEIDFIEQSDIVEQIASARDSVEQLLVEAQKGLLVREGARVTIIGRPNAGKSSLLNQLARRDVAIVTHIAGTTRDVIEQSVDLDGVPVTFIDTAGLNDRPDGVERIGIERTILRAKEADLLVFLFDVSEYQGQSMDEILGDYASILKTNIPVVYAANKIDIQPEAVFNANIVPLSAKTGLGIDALVQAIKASLNLNEREPEFSARSRHVDALKKCLEQIKSGLSAFAKHQTAELLAEDLRQSQGFLSAITGDLSADDLLGEIFSGFCIGK